MSDESSCQADVALSQSMALCQARPSVASTSVALSIQPSLYSVGLYTC